MQYTLVNQDFTKSIQSLRKILPKLAFGLLIGTYLISALIMGIFHSEASSSWGFKVAAFLVPFAIQAGRGALVFFFQLNPIHLQSKISFGTIAATALLILSLVEACLVMYPFGISWTLSVSSLMLIGWIIEIMLLKETQYATQWELYQNQELWQEIKQFYIAQQEMKELWNTKLPLESMAIEKKEEKVFTEVIAATIEENITEEEEPKIVPLKADPLIEFYGVTLDPNNPFLSVNLKRLENRFLERYEASLEKDRKRQALGKSSHKTTLQSIKDNKERLDKVRTLRQELLGETIMQAA